MQAYFGVKKTPGGFTMDEVRSALQKDIRRGNEREALFWASEIDLAGNANYLWKVLTVICSEDVGPGWPEGPAVLAALRSSWAEAKRDAGKDAKPGTGRLYTIHAVLLLCRVGKSRVVDNACNVFYNGDRAAMGIAVPDYALDHHTGQGRRLGRSEATVYDESYRIENCTVDDPYAEDAKQIDVNAAATKANGRSSSRSRLLAALHVVYKALDKDHGDDGRGYALALATDLFEREITSSADLTNGEARVLLDRLKREQT